MYNDMLRFFNEYIMAFCTYTYYTYCTDCDLEDSIQNGNAFVLLKSNTLTYMYSIFPEYFIIDSSLDSSNQILICFFRNQKVLKTLLEKTLEKVFNQKYPATLEATVETIKSSFFHISQIVFISFLILKVILETFLLVAWRRVEEIWVFSFFGDDDEQTLP